MKKLITKNTEDVIVPEAKAVMSTGGTVGRIEYNKRPEIAMRLKYINPETNDEQFSDFYVISPWAARYAGFHLFRRGVVDGAKQLAKNLLKGVKCHA